MLGKAKHARYPFPPPRLFHAPEGHLPALAKSTTIEDAQMGLSHAGD